VLDAIDSVHGDGELPDLPIVTQKRTRSGQMGGFEVSRSGEKYTGAIRIVINSAGENMEFYFAHEVGHFLDFQAIEGLGFASRNIRSEDSLMAEWAKAVTNSKAAQTLLSKYKDPENFRVEISVGGGGGGIPRRYQSTPDKNHLRYLLGTDELWARSYAQYIAESSGSSILLEQLERERQDKVYGERQWETDDFKPIREAIDNLFSSLGWR